jgi:uncharacterized protein
MGDLPVQLGATRRLAPDAAVPAELRLPFHLLAKPSGPICNLDCQYCFFLSKEALYPGDRFRMGDDLVETYLRQLLDAQPDGTVVIAWQGGEPTLMGVDFFARAVETAERLRRPGQTLEHTMQTNGTLLDDAWGELLARHGFLVGLSIDGPPALHDAYRVDKRGEPTSAKVLRGWEVLRRHGVAVNVLCTVHAANQDHPVEVYRYLRDTLGAQHVQLIPIVEQVELDGVPTGELTERSVDPAAWGGFLVAVFDEWLAHDVGCVFVQMFDAALGSWYGVGSSMCIFRPTCGDALALEHNGDVYSCDHFVDPEHLLGNIATTQMVELVRSPRQRAFGRAKADTLPDQCRRCDVRFACNGECPKNRIALSVDGEPGLNHLCAGYYEFFHHIDGPMRIMSDLLRAGRAPAEFAAVVAAAGRNEPCPCGSGRKTKHCHG